MADMINPLTPAEMQVQQQAIDRQRKIAEYLQQQSLTPDQGQMVSGHYVAPSPMQYIAKLAQGLIGKNQQDSLDQKQKDIVTQQGDLQRFLYGIGKNPQAAQPTPAATQDPVSQALGEGAKAGSVGPTNENLGRLATALAQPQPAATTTPAQPAQASSPFGSRLIPGMDPMTAFGMANDPKTEAAYAAAFLKQYEPTEFSKDVKLLPENLRSAAVTQKFLPPIINRGFGVLTTNPLTGKLENDPASMEGIDKSKAIEGKYDVPITLNTSSGQGIQLSKPEWAEYQKTGTLPLRFLPPETRKAMQEEADSSGKPSDVNIKTPQGMVSGKVAPNGVGQIGVSQTPFNQALDKDEAGRVSKMTEDIYDKGTHAIDKIAQNNKLIELLPQVTTGPLNKQITMIKNLANSVGVDIGDPAPNQEFEKYAIQGALATAKQIYGARITNQDVMTQIASNPGATMAEKAAYQMLKYDNEIQQRHLQKMTALAEYRRGGGDPREFQVYFAQKYPFQGITAPETGESRDFKVETPPVVRPANAQKNGAPNYQELYGIKVK